VVGGEEPAPPAVGDGEVVRPGLGRGRRRGRLRGRGRGQFGGGAHLPFRSSAFVGAPAGAGKRSLRSGVPPGRSDLMNATSLSKSSSLTWPWNVGMIGCQPRTTLARGLTIDSRM